MGSFDHLIDMAKSIKYEKPKTKNLYTSRNIEVVVRVLNEICSLPWVLNKMIMTET